MQELLEKLSLDGKFRYEKGKSLLIDGTEKNLRIMYALYIMRKYGGKVFFVCRNDFDAQNTYDEIKKYVPENKVVFYPSEPFYFSFPDSYSTESGIKRLHALMQIKYADDLIVVLGSWALCETFPKIDLDSITEYHPGDELDMQDFIDNLVRLGYSRDEQTYAKGQFSVRGGIVDFFSPNDDNPTRVEFYADEIDSIRSFSADSKLTIKNLSSFRVMPFNQYVIDEKELIRAYSAMCEEREILINHITNEDLKDVAIEESDNLLEKISLDLNEASRLLYPFAKVERSCVFDYTSDALFIFNDLGSLNSGADESYKRITSDYLLLTEKALAYKTQLNMFNDFSVVLKNVRERFSTVFFPSVNSSQYDFCDEQIYMGCADLMNFKGNIRHFLASLEMYEKNNYTIVICCINDEQKSNVEALCESYGIKYSSVIKKGSLCIICTSAFVGVDFVSEKVLLIPYEYLIPRKTLAPKHREDAAKEFFSDIKPGDYVVHETHGIGRYEGIVRLEFDGTLRDYIKICYAKEDILYVPPEQLDLIQKYVGANETPPKITRLGSSDWANTKKKVSKAVKELAEEYLKMYAQRQTVKGYAFSEDSVWQSEFEDKFEFVPTPDQVKCAEEIKEDMSKPSPMDRLLLGDVGYGKTEVAMRAAFKAVMEPKQVAVLVPTTILALQHYNNFKERFKDYPINIELMCRFRTPKQIKQTAEKLIMGKVDILIGTHRILSDDVQFKDLGLLIIDEEQRFGVAHKDKLKLLKSNVDTLTLSATPIPRTLHMSLSGIRDLSIINTPPSERLEVQTYVMPSDDTVIKSAITNEMNRGGQVFYLYNKVETIAERAFRISSLVPEARVVYAHGQMRERELEQIILDFLDFKYDVLVCTTIIENGVDITNANTIIIEDADKLGLSQLYQLRGRVGRGSTRAYAYMLYKPNKMLNETASKRLKTIKEFTKFGSGFKVAMRDLQIRGAGNILGANQHGHFANVGYEMYCRMLSEAVSESMGEGNTNKKRICEIDLKANAYIPNDYIESEEARIEAYKNIALIQNEDDLSRVADELTDVYSDMPKVVYNLLRVALIKATAAKAGIVKIRQNANVIVVEFDNDVYFDGEFITEIGKQYKIKLKNSADRSTLSVFIPDKVDLLSFVYEFVIKFVYN